MSQKQTCIWQLDDLMDGDLWETSCGQAFQFTDGGPEDNQFKFCYRCGKEIEVVRISETDEIDSPELTANA